MSKEITKSYEKSKHILLSCFDASDENGDVWVPARASEPELLDDEQIKKLSLFSRGYGYPGCQYVVVETVSKQEILDLVEKGRVRAQAEKATAEKRRIAADKFRAKQELTRKQKRLAKLSALANQS